METTNSLRKVIETALNSIKSTYGIKEVSYRIASTDAMYPHVVYHITSVTPADMGRLDFLLDIDVWDKNQARAFEILDAIRTMFAFWNVPQDDILPTFYDESTGTIDDPDKTIIHLVLRLQGQVYKGVATNGSIIH